MTISEFLSNRMREIIVRVVFAAAAAFLLLATGTQAGVVALLGIFWVLVSAGLQAADFLCCRSYLQELESIMDGLDKKYLFAECAPRGRGVYERKILDLSRRAGRAMAGAVSDAQALVREYREYVESWVHEIKAPITAAGLICRNAAPQVRGKLSCELARIAAHVERVLFYARAENPEKDFLIRQVNLGEIVAQAIGQYRALLMESGVRVETADLERTVFTDSKWAAFLLGQLLQNAARYHGETPVITISAEEALQGNTRYPGDVKSVAVPQEKALRGNTRYPGDVKSVAAPEEEALCGEIPFQENNVDNAAAGKKQVRLIVKDNGIGIPAHELPRVFERGFTGSNGRARGGSTGMGLYLCRKLAGSLEIDLQIASKIGEGTTVTLTFPAK